MTDEYRPGKWKAICDSCGFEFFNDELRDRWDGFKVCKADWEPRHPQEFLRNVPESTIPWSRPEPADIFIGPSYGVDSYYWAANYTNPDDPDFSANRYIDSAA